MSYITCIMYVTYDPQYNMSHVVRQWKFVRITYYEHFVEWLSYHYYYCHSCCYCYSYCNDIVREDNIYKFLLTLGHFADRHEQVIEGHLPHKITGAKPSNYTPRWKYCNSGRWSWTCKWWFAIRAINILKNLSLLNNCKFTPEFIILESRKKCYCKIIKLILPAKKGEEPKIITKPVKIRNEVTNHWQQIFKKVRYWSRPE